MTPQTLTKAAFARICGVTKPGIAKAVTSGKVNLHGKKVNLDHRLTKEYYFGKKGTVLNPADHVKVKKTLAPKQSKKKAKKKTIIKPITAPPDDGEELNPDIDLDNLEYENGYTLPKGINCFEDITIHNLHLIPADLVKKVKDLEVAKKAKQDREEKRGKLIERKTVKQVFAQIHMVDTNQWKTLENKIIPEMCSILKFQDGGDQAIEARKMITTEVNKILKFTKRLIDEFFEKNKEE